jgi:hypothetical protein
MFYRQASNQYITEGQSFEIAGTSYPANWLNCSTPEEKTALGLVEVTDSNSPEDDRFYWVSAALNGAVRTYTNTPKDLAALKTQWTAQIRASAYSMLLPSDWMVVKAMETQTTVPTEWNTYRAAVRTACANAVTAVNAATDVPALQVAVQVVWPKDPDEQVKNGN